MAARCEWCLEFFDAIEQKKTQEQLGALKTRLMIPDAASPVICDGCYDVTMRAQEPMSRPNRRLLCY